MHSLSHTHTYTVKKSSALRCVHVDYLTHTPRAQNQKAMSVVVAALHSLGREAEKKGESEGERKVLRERPEST